MSEGALLLLPVWDGCEGSWSVGRNKEHDVGKGERPCFRQWQKRAR